MGFFWKHNLVHSKPHVPHESEEKRHQCKLEHIPTIFSAILIQSRPINVSQRASPAAFTVTTRCAMAHQTPHLLTRCSDAQMKVLLADMEMALGMARQKPLTQLEEKMVSRIWCFTHACNLNFYIQGLVSGKGSISVLLYVNL